MAKKKKKPKIQTDSKGPFYYRTYFVRGKQKREKVRGFVEVDGEPVDRDEYLRANASELDLHQMGEYELLHEVVSERNEVEREDGLFQDKVAKKKIAKREANEDDIPF